MRGTKRTRTKTPASDLRPGQHAPTSGVYEVVHGAEHRASQRGVMVRGQVFPYCKECREEVRYVLVEPAPHILEDEDFRAKPRERG